MLFYDNNNDNCNFNSNSITNNNNNNNAWQASPFAPKTEFAYEMTGINDVKMDFVNVSLKTPILVHMLRKPMNNNAPNNFALIYINYSQRREIFSPFSIIFRRFCP